MSRCQLYRNLALKLNAAYNFYECNTTIASSSHSTDSTTPYSSTFFSSFHSLLTISSAKQCCWWRNWRRCLTFNSHPNSTAVSETKRTIRNWHEKKHQFTVNTASNEINICGIGPTLILYLERKHADKACIYSQRHFAALIMHSWG